MWLSCSAFTSKAVPQQPASRSNGQQQTAHAGGQTERPSGLDSGTELVDLARFERPVARRTPISGARRRKLSRASGRRRSLEADDEEA